MNINKKNEYLIKAIISNHTDTPSRGGGGLLNGLSSDDLDDDDYNDDDSEELIALKSTGGSINRLGGLLIHTNDDDSLHRLYTCDN